MIQRYKALVHVSRGEAKKIRFFCPCASFCALAFASLYLLSIIMD